MLNTNSPARLQPGTADDLRSPPSGVPSHSQPPLLGKRPPRCPPFVEVLNSDQLLPYLEHVARRPYNHGLNACWDLKEGERVLLRVDNWHSELTIQACQKILEKYKVKYEIQKTDRGPVPQWVGADEVEYYLFRTKELAEWMDMWEEEEKKQKYDKILMGYGGPVLAERFIKIQRMPFITPEILASPAHAMPIEVINAMDRWAWDRIRNAKRVRITDPEGTDLSFTNHDEYWDAKREFYNAELTATTWRGNEHFGKTYLPGHITGRPWMFHPTKEDGCGVIAGTTNHIAPVDWTQLVVENSKITKINAGGAFGDKLREVMDLTEGPAVSGRPEQGDHALVGGFDRHQPAHPPAAQGLPLRLRQLPLRARALWRDSHRLRHHHLVDDRARSRAHRASRWSLASALVLPHLHGRAVGRQRERDRKRPPDGARRSGNPQALLEVRRPDLWLDESWNPAVPGINMAGGYWEHYAKDPLHWVKTELEVCRNYHPMFMKMVGADDKYCRGEGAKWWKGDCCDHSGVKAPVLPGNCCDPTDATSSGGDCCHAPDAQASAHETEVWNPLAGV